MIEKIKYINYLPITIDTKHMVIIGSAVLIAHGVDMVNNDLDVVVRRDVFNEFLSKRDVVCDKTYTVSNHIEMSYSSTMTGKSFNELNKNADIIEKYSFMCLADLKEMYLALGREKDKEKLIIIDKLLRKIYETNN